MVLPLTARKTRAFTRNTVQRMAAQSVNKSQTSSICFSTTLDTLTYSLSPSAQVEMYQCFRPERFKTRFYPDVVCVVSLGSGLSTSYILGNIDGSDVLPMQDDRIAELLPSRPNTREMMKTSNCQIQQQAYLFCSRNGYVPDAMHSFM